MAQMAIKNEANTFTQINTFSNSIRAFNGTTLLPSYSFTTDPSMGIYFAGVNLLGIAIAGITRQTVTPNGISVTGEVSTADGVAGTPAYNFTSEAGMGMFRESAGRLGFAVGGTRRMFIEAGTMRVSVFLDATASIQFAGTIRGSDGSETLPGYAFTSDAGTGMWASATSCNLSANGQTIASFTSSSDIFAGVGRSWSGQSDRTEARPAFNFNSDPDTGFYNNAANSIGWATAGVSRGTLDASAIWCANGVSIHGDAAGDVSDPAYAFTNDTDSGLFRVSANSVSIGAGGVSILNFDQATSSMWAGAGMHFRNDGATTPGTPVYSFTNDTDTGMYRRAANAIGFASAGAEIFNIGSGGIGVISGKLCFFNLPTSAGTSGSLWNSGGTVRVA
jgi:hypothetical protein